MPALRETLIESAFPATHPCVAMFSRLSGGKWCDPKTAFSNRTLIVARDGK
jgi:hypothetical protein